MSGSNKIKISGIVKIKDLVLISVLGVSDRPGIAGEVMSALGENNINVVYISEGSNADDSADIYFCIKKDDLDKVKNILKDYFEKIKTRDIKYDTDVVIIGVYGPHFREKPAIAGRFFRALGSEHVNILSISTSISTISCVISKNDLDRTKKAIDKVFEIPK
ncbi:MAG: ACT domain-containing protein [Candidatus Marinimicrobia bacterium]|nr:ACT domain-containing protein [Candidatus Neomarinimicrobiota bacterium]